MVARAKLRQQQRRPLRQGAAGAAHLARPCSRAIPLAKIARIEDKMLRLLSNFAVLLSLSVTVAEAQQYPDHPVKVIVGYAAGGGPDIQARTLSAQLSLDLGQQFFVENRTGA